jgi:hypothetical protein
MSLLDRFRTKQPPRKARGGSGRAHTRGYLEFEELNQLLVGQAGLRIFDKMYRTDPDVRRVVWMFINPLIAATWNVDPFGGDGAEDKDRKIAEDVEWALFDHMRPNLAGHLSQALPVLARSGFAPFEQVWEAAKRDGRELLVPQTLDLRLPRTIQRFIQKGGELTALEQLLATGVLPDGTDAGSLIELPMENLVYYRIGAEGDNWEGTSLLRAAYKPWFFKDNLERIAVIKAEREAVGVPIAYPPESKGDEQLDELEEILGGLRTNEQGYIIAPGPHADNSEEGKGWRIEILGTGAQSSAESKLHESLSYFTDKIAAAFVAEFMRLGQDGVGARATADVQQNPFLTAVEAFAGIVEDQLNDTIVQRFVALNYPDVEEPPRLTMSLVDSTSLTELADYVSKLVQGNVLVADSPLEDFLRERGDLPPADPEARQAHEEAQKAAREAIKAGGPPGQQATDPEGRNKGGGTASDDDEPPAQEPPARQKTMARREPRWWEAPVALDELRFALDNARARFEAAGGPEARALAVAYATKAGKGTRPRALRSDALADALYRELAGLYELGRATVAEELAVQRGEPEYSPEAMVMLAWEGKDGKQLANWVEQQGGLPSYFHRIMRHLPKQWTKSRKIATAVSQSKKFCAKGNADACAAVAQWGAMRARAHAMDAVLSREYTLDEDEELRDLRRRALLAAAAIAERIRQAIERVALERPNPGVPELQSAGEREAGAGLRAEAQLHAAGALNEGRQDEAEDHDDEIAGSRYTSILDDNRCEQCALADDDVLRPLDDPVRLERRPPNPDCYGGGRCRCIEVFQLQGEEAPALMRELAHDADPLALDRSSKAKRRKRRKRPKPPYKPKSAPGLGYRTTWADAIANLGKMQRGDTVVLNVVMGESPALYAKQYAQLRARGINVRVVLAGSTQPTLKGWAAHVGAAARAFPGATLELWNEPNLLGFGGISPDYFAQMVRVARQAAPSARLDLGALAPVGPWGKQNAYMQRLRALGVFGLVDGAAMHIYPEMGRDCAGVKCSIKQMLKTTGLRADQLSISEFGVGDTKLSQREQEKLLKQSYRDAAEAGVQSLSLYAGPAPAPGSPNAPWWESMNPFGPLGTKPWLYMLREETETANDKTRRRERKRDRRGSGDVKVRGPGRGKNPDKAYTRRRPRRKRKSS